MQGSAARELFQLSGNGFFLTEQMHWAQLSGGDLFKGSCVCVQPRVQLSEDRFPKGQMSRAQLSRDSFP